MEPDQWGDGGGRAAQRLTDAQRIRKRSAVPMGGAIDDNGTSFTVSAPIPIPQNGKFVLTRCTAQESVAGTVKGAKDALAKKEELEVTLTSMGTTSVPL